MRTRHGLILLFVFALAHRALQWMLLWPEFESLAARNADFLAMQLLPAQWWQVHFLAALWYLQQTPPIPNLLFGLVTVLTDDFVSRSAVLILFSGFLDCIAGVLFAVLLLRLQLSRALAFSAAVVFVLGNDLLVNEYAAFGQLFYEQLTMVEVLVAALAAITIARRPALAPVLCFGICVALLGLTRASFTYFFIPALVWLLWALLTRRSARLLGWFVLPVLLLHGGWAAKQLVVQQQWLWSSSSWGGANMQVGEIKRAMRQLAEGEAGTIAEAKQFADRLQQQPCLARWQPIAPVFAFGSAAGSVAIEAKQLGPSASARVVDKAAAEVFGQVLPSNSAAFRELSQCLQQAMIAGWWHDPAHALKGWWMSYGIFWSSIADFADVFPSVLLPARSRWQDPLQQPWWRPQGVMALSPDYLMRSDTLARFVVREGVQARPVSLLALPLLPGLMALLALWGVHLLPLAVLGGSLAPRLPRWPAGLSFMALAYAYLAVVANLAEFGENMRFRLAVEPLCWAMALVVVAQFAAMVRASRPNRGIQPSAPGL
jgi:hypothetical protein